MNAGTFKDRREHILLTEQNFGLLDGLTDEECSEKYPEEARKYNLCAEYSGKFYAKPSNGESRYDVCVRAHQFFGTTLRTFTMMWLHKEIDWFEPTLLVNRMV